MTRNEWSVLTSIPANISSYELDDSVLENLREYSLTNSLYWALAEGHACEQSARRNAMDVSLPQRTKCKCYSLNYFSDHQLYFTECFQERR